MNVCHTCGIPVDAGFFDEASIKLAPTTEYTEIVLAQYKLHSNHCGVFMNFAQFTDVYAQSNMQVQTPGLQWQIRCNGQPRDPYLTFQYILNPWGYSGMPVQLRLEEGCLIEMVVRKVPLPTGIEDPPQIKWVGGRITGRYWYNTDFGGAPNRL
jgi:hypothetical protein